MKRISIFLAFLLLLQSCNVYNKPATVETAVAADEKVKVFTTDEKKYKFRRLENKNDRLIGITKEGSSTAQKLAGMPAQIDGKYVEFDISKVEIDRVLLRNKSSSTVLTVVAVAASMVVGYIVYAFMSMALSDDFMENL